MIALPVLNRYTRSSTVVRIVRYRRLPDPCYGLGLVSERHQLQQAEYQRKFLLRYPDCPSSISWNWSVAAKLDTRTTRVSAENSAQHEGKSIAIGSGFKKPRYYPKWRRSSINVRPR